MRPGDSRAATKPLALCAGVAALLAAGPCGAAWAADGTDATPSSSSSSMGAASGLPPAAPGSGLGIPGVGSSGGPLATVGDVAHSVGPLGGIGGGPGPNSGFTITPRVSLSEAFNDNVYLTQHGRRADAITYFTPGINISGETAHLQGNLDYAPTVVLYGQHGNLNDVAQNLNANLLATVIENAFYVNLRGYAAITPTQGGVPSTGGGFATPSSGSGGNGSASFGGGPGALGRQNQTQTYDAAITPYYVHRFGGTGTLKIGYTLEKTISEGQTNNGFNGNGFNEQNQFFNNNNNSFNGNRQNSNLLTNSETIQFNTGEDLGRIRDQVLLSGTQSTGSGAAGQSSQYIATNDLGYAITRRVTVFGELGYEKIRYDNTQQPYHVDDPVWAIGVTLTPKADSSITVGFQHKYGFDSFFLDAGYPVTARTRAFARYYTGLGTNLQNVQTAVANSGVDEFGNTVDLTTGAPIFLNGAGQINTGNNALYQSKNFSAGVTTSLNRDTVSLLANYTQQNQVAVARGFVASGTFPGASGSNDTLSTSVSWTHEIDPVTQSNVYLSYGTQSFGQQFNGQNGDENFVSAQASITRALSDSVTGVVQYTGYARTSNLAGRSYSQNVVLVGLTKRF